MGRQRPGRLRHFDKHHILNPRQEWTLRPQAEWLREQPTLVPRIDRDIHDVLHRVTPPVPLLGYHALRIVANDFVPGRTTMESIDRLATSIEYAAEHPRAHPLEVDLAELAVNALMLQRNVLRGNVVELRVVK